MFVDWVATRRLTAMALWGTLAAASAYLYFFDPGKTGFFPICPFRALTGLNCPGCGTTRALHQLLHGNLVAAFEFNPLTMLLLPAMLGALVLYTTSAITARPLPQFHIPTKYVWLSVVVVLGFWVFRNTPLYPFPS